MRSTAELSKNDYEFYSIPVPLRMSFGRRTRKFLYSELEKRHPCFSSSCAFDYNLSIGKKGLKSDVVVLDKMRLSEYKRKLGYRGFFLSETKKRFFVSERYKIFKKVFLFFLLVILVSFAIFGIPKFISKASDFSARRLGEQEKNLWENYENELNKETGIESNSKMQLWQSLEKNLIGELFDVVSKNEGVFESLDWKIENGSEKISCMIRNIFPEHLQSLEDCNLKASDLSYKNGVPYLFVNCERIFPGSEQMENIIRIGNEQTENALRSVGKDIIQNDIFPPITAFELRKVFLKTGIEVLEEKNQPKEFSFLIRNNLDFTKSVFEELFLLLNNSTLFVSAINFSNCSSEKVTVKIKIEEWHYNNDYSASDDSFLSENLSKSIWETVSDNDEESAKEIAKEISIADGQGNVIERNLETAFESEEPFFCVFLEQFINNLSLLGFNKNINSKETPKSSLPASGIRENSSDTQKIGAGVAASKSFPENSESNNSSVMRKLGVVTYADGRKIIYYKTSDGKIIGVENEKK